MKQALCYLFSSRISGDKRIFFATYGLYFFGVPNEGMDIEALTYMVRGQPNEALIWALGQDSQLLRGLFRDFAHKFTFTDSQIISFYETEMTASLQKVS